MKQPARVSPFMARTSQEQKEQWIVWQAQQNATMPIEKTAPPQDVSQRPQPAVPQPLHHSQYDAVISRISAAQRRTGAFVQVHTKAPGHR